MELPVRTLDLGGTSLEVRVKEGGAGDPIVFLHPWFGCWQFWRHALAQLPERTCYAADLYTLGAGEGWRPWAGPLGLAYAVMAFLDAEGIERCTLVGNSMGGIAAQVVALTLRERIGRLVLVGTGARVSAIRSDYKVEMESWAGSDPDREKVRALTLRLLSRRPPEDELAVYHRMVSEANREFMVETLRRIAVDLRHLLPRVTAETLVVRGDRDVARTREHVRDLLLAVPGSVAVELPGAGHSPQVDSPELFVPLLRSFVLEGRAEGASRELAAA